MNMRWSARDIPIERKNNQNCVAPLPTIAKLYALCCAKITWQSSVYLTGNGNLSVDRMDKSYIDTPYPSLFFRGKKRFDYLNGIVSIQFDSFLD